MIQSSPDELRRIWIMGAVFVAVYFVQLTRYPLSIDAEMAHYLDPIAWISQGRWGAYLVTKYVLPNPVIPFVPHAMFGVSCVLSFALISRMVEWRCPEPLPFAVFSSFPIWFFLLAFPANTAATALGLASSTAAAALLFASRPWWALTLAAALLAFAVSLYQSFLLLFVCVFLMILIVRATSSHFNLRDLPVHVAKAVVTIISAALFYSMVNIAFLEMFGLSQAYISSIANIDILLSNPWGVWNAMKGQMALVYTGDAEVYGVWIPSIPVLIMLALASIFYCHPVFRATILATGIAILLVLPFALNPLTAGVLPYRTFVALPVVMSTILAVSLAGPRYIRYAANAAGVLLVFHSVVAINQWQAVKDTLDTHDRLLASAIYTRIAEVNDGFDRDEIYRVDTFGAKSFSPQYSVGHTSTLSRSFFEWDGGVPWRIVNFMNIIGFGNLAVVPSEERLLLRPEYADMPVWPASGSVRNVNGVTLIKLGPEPGYYVGG